MFPKELSFTASWLAALVAACYHQVTPKEALSQAPDTLKVWIPIDYDTSQWYWIREPAVKVDLRYATKKNFVGRSLYSCSRCFLRKEAAKALLMAAKELKQQGYQLVVWDCYRPVAVQWALWRVFPNPNYVAPPFQGSWHNKGLAVDVSLADRNGNLLDMGTDFDDFSEKAHRGYQQLPKQVLKRRWLLYKVMRKQGFWAHPKEWWHFVYLGKDYPLSHWQWRCP